MIANENVYIVTKQGLFQPFESFPAGHKATRMFLCPRVFVGHKGQWVSSLRLLAVCVVERCDDLSFAAAVVMGLVASADAIASTLSDEETRVVSQADLMHLIPSL